MRKWQDTVKQYTQEDINTRDRLIQHLFESNNELGRIADDYSNILKGSEAKVKRIERIICILGILLTMMTLALVK